MTAQTGRTVNKWVAFLVEDSGGTIRNIPVNSINGVGLAYDEMDVTAFTDSIKNALPGHPDCTISISGPFDNTALVGSHTVLSGINGGVTPLALDVQVGIKHAWEADEPQFGLTATATSGFICTNYSVDMSSMEYSATFKVIGSTAPAWGTAAETT